MSTPAEVTQEKEYDRIFFTQPCAVRALTYIARRLGHPFHSSTTGGVGLSKFVRDVTGTSRGCVGCDVELLVPSPNVVKILFSANGLGNTQQGVLLVWPRQTSAGSQYTPCQKTVHIDQRG